MSVKEIEEMLYGDEFGRLGDIVRLGEKAIPKLTEILQNHSDSLLRQRAAVALGRIGSREAVGPLVATLSVKEIHVVLSILDALAILGDRSACKAILPLLKSEDSSLRRSAARALGKLADADMITHLEEVTMKDKHDFVRKEASKAIQRIYKAEKTKTKKSKTKVKDKK